MVIIHILFIISSIWKKTIDRMRNYINSIIILLYRTLSKIKTRRIYFSNIKGKTFYTQYSCSPINTVYNNIK